MFAFSRSTDRARTVRSGTLFSIEQMEGRQMRAVTYGSDTSFWNDMGDVFAVAQFGDNGGYSGYTGVVAGAGGNEIGYAPICWDGDTDDGIDSGDVESVFGVNITSSHVASWMVAGQSITPFSVSSTISISSVTIGVAVSQNGEAVDWTGVQVDFYHAGSIVETVGVNDLHANTLNSSATDAAAWAKVTPTASNVDGVRVVGSYRVRAEQGVYPDPGDLSGQITVN